MADNKTGPNIGAGAGVFAKRVQKSLNRAQEKVMQKLGKTMETRDEHFEQSFQNLIKQQSDGGRLLKDVRTYFTTVKAMHESSRRLSQTLADVYEPDWQGGEDLPVIMESEDLLWNDYEEKLADQIVRTMENYNSQFSEIKERVSKRGRKLVDYDSSRHHLEALQNAKKKDEGKITKAEEEFNKAQSVFEEINKELREELPLLYQSRIGCYVTVFQNISNLRDVFYKEMSKLNHELYNVIKKLETQHSGKSFIIKGLNSSKSNRKSLVISAPIPCNTAFPADHTSLHASSAPNGKDSAPSAQPQSISEELTQEDGNICQAQSLSDSDEHSSTGAGTPKRQSVCDSENSDTCDVTSEGPSRRESLVQEEDQVSIQSEGTVQVSSQSKEATTPEVAPPISMESNMPAPQPEQGKISEVEPQQNTKLPPVPAPAGDTYQNPPGFLYKAVALESSGEGQLQFKKGDVILVLADTEEKEGVARGVTEESWIQHRDLADHADAFPDKLIQMV